MVMGVITNYVTPGVYQTTFAHLTGTLSYDGRSLDLGTAHTPFFGTATGLSFTGYTPAAVSTVADGQRLTPGFTGRSGAAGALPLIDAAVATVSSLRAYLGAVQNRFERTAVRLGGALTDTTASLSRIDTDVAAEMSELTRSQVLTQAGTAVLGQATLAPQTLLSLLTA